MPSLAFVLSVSLLLIGSVSSMLQNKAWDTLNACFNSKNATLNKECNKAFGNALRATGIRLKFEEDQLSYLASLEREFLKQKEEVDRLVQKQRRAKRSIGGHHPYFIPVRRECRLLSHLERYYLFLTIRALKEKKIGTKSCYDTLAELHLGMTVDAHAHGGSNFFGWHRVYLLFFEMALRRIRHGVTMCFWDTTMEYRLGRAHWRDTAVFSSQFFGNRRGEVVTGPFAKWPMPPNLQEFGPFLTRDVGVRGMPVDARAAWSIFYSPNTLKHKQITIGGCKHETITTITGRVRNITVESEHNNVHNFVGRVMIMTGSSPQDPIFFFHHCYIDYMWEKFREKMKRFGRNPALDYPGISITNPILHGPKHPMIGFPGYYNIDGYSDYFTTYLYRYETPTCYACLHSPYASCDAFGQCIARTITAGTELVDGGWFPGTEPGSPRANALETTADVAFAIGADTGVGVPTAMGRRFPEASRSE